MVCTADWLPRSKGAGWKDMRTGYFEEQLRYRQQHDQQELYHSMRETAEAIRGKDYYRAGEKADENLLRELQNICEFYQLPFPEQMRYTSDEQELTEVICGSLGIMRRHIYLDKVWWKDGDGVILAIGKTDGRYYALLPRKQGGYCFIGQDGKRIHITKKNREMFEREALLFYRPLPMQPMSKKQFLRFLYKHTPLPDFAFVVIVTGITALIGMLVPFATNLIFTEVIPLGRMTLLIMVGILLVSTALSTYLFQSVRSSLLSRIRGRISVTMENAMMGRIMNLPVKFFKDKSTGSLSDCILILKILPEALTNSLILPVISAVFSLVYIIEILAFIPQLALPAFVTIVVQVLVIAICILQKTRMTQKELEGEIKAQGMSYAMITGIERIRLSGSETRVLARWLNVYKDKGNAAYAVRFPAFIQNELVGFASLLGMLWAFIAGAQSGISIPQFATFASAFSLVTETIMYLSTASGGASMLGPVLSLIEPVLKADPEKKFGKTFARISGKIELNNVSFRYQPEDPLVLDGLNLRINSGEYVAIVGKSGCGKSTILRILMGFETPTQGTVLYDNQNLSDLNPAALRRNIGTVLQNGKLFAESIFANITISAPWLKEKEAWEAAEIAGIAEDIRNMPMKMNTLISEGGGGISGGQKQRLMIARAVAPKPKVLMFDEATSALDNITQKKVSESLDRMNCTRIVVAHRLSTIRNCDRIIVMDHGKIIEEGTYEGLIAQKGFFADLVKRQQLEETK